ncbi:MAG TPA: ATP-binding protein, partial [Dehalococcoidia bacterium]|nr:ATP-binding protein [Dehalococcoidia bacterium]
MSQQERFGETGPAWHPADAADGRGLTDVVRSLPEDVFEQLNKDIGDAGGEWSEGPEYVGSIGRSMFDLPSSEDNTVTVLLPKDAIAKVPSQSLVRIRSVPDGRTYLGIVVKGPFAEPDGLRGDAPVMITTSVRGGIFMPRYHGRVHVELLGEQLGDVLIPPRLRPLPNSPVFVLDADQTERTLQLQGDIELGVPVGYEDIAAAIPSDRKAVLPRHVGILGTTGGGKSTTVSGLVASFQRAGLASVLIDTEGEYTQIYEPTDDPVMVAALGKRHRSPSGVERVRVFHLHGRETTCPDTRRVTSFSLQFSQLSPYLVAEVLDLNEAQQQRFQKAYDITKEVLKKLQIFPKTQEDRDRLLELDELEEGYPGMRVQHLYDVTRACADVVAGEKKVQDIKEEAYPLQSAEFRSPAARAQIAEALAKESDLPKHPASWRVVQGRLSQLLRLKIFDNPAAPALNYRSLTEPGRVSIVDLSDVDSPQINNLVIAELLRGLHQAQDANYQAAETGRAPQRRVMVLIEEAHEFLSSERIKQMPILFQQVARIARRGRKRWLGLVFITQLPQHLPDEVLGLINNYILHKIADANVIGRLKRSLGVVDESLWRRLPSLAPGQALVAMSSFARPLLVNIN